MVLTVAHPARRYRGPFGGDFDRLLGEFFTPLSEVGGSGNRMVTPAINVREAEKGFVVEAELPGVAAGDVDIEVHERQLTIRGHRRGEKEEKDGKYTRKEMWAGEFVRTLDLPSEVDDAGIAATMRNGVLTVTLPRAQSSIPRKVAISGE